MVDQPTWGIIGALFIGSLVRAVFGFGEALFSVPLLALLIPVEQAVPVTVLVSITIALVILVMDWRNVQLRSASRLVLSSLFGIPVGLYILKTASEGTVKAILALIIMVFCAHAYRDRRKQHRSGLKHDGWAWLFGFNAGVLGGAYGMNGPPLVIYGSLRGWQPEEFRATLQAYFLPASIVGMAGYWSAGLWTPAVSQYYIAALPAVIVATLGGRVIGSRLEAERFTLYVYAALAVIAVILLFQAIAAQA